MRARLSRAVLPGIGGDIEGRRHRAPQIAGETKQKYETDTLRDEFHGTFKGKI